MLAVRGSQSAARIARLSQAALSTHDDGFHHYPLAESSRCRSTAAVAGAASSSSSTSTYHISSSSHRACLTSRRCFSSSASIHDSGSTAEPAAASRSKPKPKVQKRRRSKADIIQDAQTFAKAIKQASLSQSNHHIPSTTRAPLPGSPLPALEFSESGKTRTPLEQIEEILQDNPLETEGGAGRLDVHAEKYKKAYKKAYTRIDHSFVLAQLRAVIPDMEAQELGKAKYRLPKAILIQQLMLRRGWLVPQNRKVEVEKVKEVMHRQTLDLPENELFLFLRDTQTVSDLAMNKGIIFSVVTIPAEDGSGQARNVLSAESTERNLQTLSNTLEKRKEHMTTLTITPDDMYAFTPSFGLLGFVSSATGAYVEPWEGNSYRISSMDPAKAAKAQRLLQVAAVRSKVLPPSRGLTIIAPTPKSIEPDPTDYFPDSHNLYSLLPYFSSPSMIVPWDTIIESFSAMSYRLRRVSSWAPKSGRREVTHRDEELGSAPVVMLKSAEGGLGNVGELGAFVEKLVPKVEPRVVNLTFGHLLAQNSSGSSPLSPPVQGQWPFSESGKYLSDIPRPIFSPSLTPIMVHHRLSNPTRSFRKLRYRTQDGKHALTFSYTYPTKAPVQTSKPEEKKAEDGNWLMQLEKMLRDVEEEDKRKERSLLGEEDEGAEADGAEGKEPEEAIGDVVGELENVAAAEEGKQQEEESTQTVDAIVEVEQSSVVEIDLMMPDRPVDGRLTVWSQISAEPTSTAIPTDIQHFFNLVASVPPPQANQPQPSSRKDPRPSAPFSITLDAGLPISASESYLLEKDEYLEIAESYTAGEDVVLRSVHARDMVLGVDRTVAHTELEYEGDQLPKTFWKEFANISKDIGPESALARDTRGLFL